MVSQFEISVSFLLEDPPTIGSDALCVDRFDYASSHCVGGLVSAMGIVRTKYKARVWQWFSTFSLKAFVDRVNHLMLVPSGEILSLGK